MDQVQTLLMQTLMSVSTRIETKSQSTDSTDSDFRKLMDSQSSQAQRSQNESTDSTETPQKDAADSTDAPQDEADQPTEEVDVETMQQLAATQLAYVDTAQLVNTQQTAPAAQTAVETPATAAVAGTTQTGNGLAQQQTAGEPSAQMTQTNAQPAQQAQTTSQPVQTAQNPQEQTQQQSTPRQSADTAAQQPQTDSDKTVVTEQGGETAVFRQTETTPIKVGETTTTPKAPEAQNVQNQVAESLGKAVESGEQKVQVQLTPEHLGKITIELTQQQDGSLRVVLQAENPHTRLLLEKDMSGLQQLLGRTTQQEVQVEVPRNQEGQQHQDLTEQEQQEQQRRQQEQREEKQSMEDFMNQLRLGLVSEEDEPA